MASPDDNNNLHSDLPGVQQKLQEVIAAREHAVAKLRQISDSQHSMLGGGHWVGGAATSYGNKSQGQHEDFEQIIAALNNIVDKAGDHVTALAKADQHH